MSASASGCGREKGRLHRARRLLPILDPTLDDELPKTGLASPSGDGTAPGYKDTATLLGLSLSGLARAVIHRLTVINSTPARNSAPAPARIA